MSYHDRIMNFHYPEGKPYQFSPRSEQIAYKEGHRDARHAAAELAIQADETIRCQQLVLDQIAEALGLEPGDVDGIGAAIGELIVDRDAAVMQLRDERNAAYSAEEIEGLKRDAARYVYLKCSGAFRCMSLDMGGKHTWTGIGRPIGKDAPTIDEAIDKALAAGEAGK